VGAQTVAVLLVAVAVAALARRRGVSAPLLLVVVGLVGGLIPGVPTITLEPDVVLFVLLPPLLWSAGLESSYVNLRRNVHPIGMLAVGLPLVTTFAVGVVAFELVPDLSLAAALTLGAIVAPPDAVSATAIGRRLGLPRRMMTLLGGESLLNDATALTAYKVALAAAIGTATGWDRALGTFALAVAGGVLVGVVLGRVLDAARTRLDDPLAESALGLVTPFLIYLIAEQVHGSGVLAVVAAALVVGQRSTTVGYATRLQDDAVWKALQLLLESFAFLLIGLQLPTVIGELAGISAATLVVASAGVLAAVIVVRIAWVFLIAYTPRLWGRSTAPASHLFVVAWAGMRGVVSLAAAFAVPLTTLSGDAFPGRPQLIFLTFVVVIGTLLLHGLTLPWLVRALGVGGDEATVDAQRAAAAQYRASAAAIERLEQLLDERRSSGRSSEVHERAGEVLRRWSTARADAALNPGETTAPVFRDLRLQMLAAERAALIQERDDGRIDDEVLRALLHGLDLEEATLNRR
jgi:monovalent cation/hydrogen antiporter